MVNMSKRQQPHRDENISPKPSSERRGNTHTTWQASADPKTSLYTCIAKELSIYNQVT